MVEYENYTTNSALFKSLTLKKMEYGPDFIMASCRSVARHYRSGGIASPDTNSVEDLSSQPHQRPGEEMRTTCSRSSECGYRRSQKMSKTASDADASGVSASFLTG